MGSGETAARETGDYIAWVFCAVVEGLEAGESTALFPPVHCHPTRWHRYSDRKRRGSRQYD